MVNKWKILSGEKGKKRRRDIVDILLHNRGVKTDWEKEDFLNPKLENVNLKSVGIKEGQVKKTIKRIQEVIAKKEKIVIYGDYDVDGICGSAILWETIFKMYNNVMPYIPHRVEEGYGLSISGIDHVILEFGKVGLIITVDNGIVANKAIDYAKEKGIDVVITDHHVAKDLLPKAYSIIHTTNLCGAGVAYLLAQEIARVRSSKFEVRSSLELVALATVADLVPLIGPNRVLVKYGIEALKNTERPGLLALFDEAAIGKRGIDVYTIGHIIAPRLNATGRIAHAMDSLRLLCTNDPVRAGKLAKHLSLTNKERQLLTEESTQHADSITISNEKVILVASKEYNQGIIGLVASRLVEKHYKPAIAISIGESYSKGSARSIKGVNIIEFIRTFSSMLADAGGHPMAAGFTIETSRIEEFRQAVQQQADSSITEDLFQKIIVIDLAINFSEITLGFFDKLRKLEPFGVSNPEPLFVSRGVKIEGLRTVGQENQHLKLQLSQGGRVLDAIYFRGSEKGLKIGDLVDIVYCLEHDVWKGRERIQLKIKDTS